MPKWLIRGLIVGFVLLIFQQLFCNRKSVEQKASGDNSKQISTTGNGSPVTYVENQTVIYKQFIEDETSKLDSNNRSSDEIVRQFFNDLLTEMSVKRNTVPQERLINMPFYLRTPSNINVTISTTHGFGYEFISPSSEPKVSVTRTDMPIEEFYFSKFSENKDISNSNIYKVGKANVIADITLVGSKQAIGVPNDSDVLLVGIAYKYSENDSIELINFLRMFGNNQKNYLDSLNPKTESDFLYDSLWSYHQFELDGDKSQK